MEIITKYNMDDTVYYLERKRVSEQCPICEGTGRINVTKGILRWNIKCPDCNGRKRVYDVVRYEVVSGIVKGCFVKHSEQNTSTKYILKNGMHKKENVLFPTMEEAEQKCKEMNMQLEQKKEIENE